MAQSGLSIYQRNRTDRGWRYQRIEEGRGVKTGRIVGRFYVRPTQADGAQNWKPLAAESSLISQLRVRNYFVSLEAP